jgi:hypothetical protein
LKYLAPIVEGHGEVQALPALLHRTAHFCGYQGQLVVNAPVRVKSGSFLNDSTYFHRQISLVTAKAVERSGGALVLLDCDDDCPAILGPKLFSRAAEVRPDVPIIVALAYREFESWFVAAVQSLCGMHGLPNNLKHPANLDGLRDAKGWLGRHMTYGYDPLVHQLDFVRAFDFDQARTCHSFRRFCERMCAFLST